MMGVSSGNLFVAYLTGGDYKKQKHQMEWGILLSDKRVSNGLQKVNLGSNSSNQTHPMALPLVLIIISLVD